MFYDQIYNIYLFNAFYIKPSFKKMFIFFYSDFSNQIIFWNWHNWILGKPYYFCVPIIILYKYIINNSIIVIPKCKYNTHSNGDNIVLCQSEIEHYIIHFLNKITSQWHNIKNVKWNITWSNTAAAVV